MTNYSLVAFFHEPEGEMLRKKGFPNSPNFNSGYEYIFFNVPSNITKMPIDWVCIKKDGDGCQKTLTDQ